MYGHSDFYRMVTEAFPELQAELDEDPELLHVQMGAFARFTEQAKGRGDWSTYQRCIALADALWRTPDAALLNALNVLSRASEFCGPPRRHRMGPHDSLTADRLAADESVPARARGSLRAGARQATRRLHANQGLHVTLVIIFGPPAVGKMAVGLELERLTGFRLFHNHMTVDPIIRLFPFESAPYRRLVMELRRRIFEDERRERRQRLDLHVRLGAGRPSGPEFVDRTTEISPAAGSVCSWS